MRIFGTFNNNPAAAMNYPDPDELGENLCVLGRKLLQLKRVETADSVFRMVKMV
jgi:hypothetical protein